MNSFPENPSRRTFLKSGAAATAAAFSAPYLLLAKKTPEANPIVGEGEFQYQCHHDWATLPDDHDWGGASHGVAVDSDGLVYITHHGSPGSLFVFEPSGKFVRSLAPEHRVGERAFGHGIDIRSEDGTDYLYLAPNNPTLGFAKYKTDGEQVWSKNRPEECPAYESPKARFVPTNTCFSPDGGFFLGDGYGSHFIHRYDADANYVSSFGGEGEGAGQFQTPHGHWLDERDGTPKIVVADRANARLQYVDLEGNHLSFIDDLLFPADVDIQNDIMLVPDLHARISLFDKNNNVITHLGDDPNWREQVLERPASGKGFKMRANPAAWQPGKFIHPHDACFDHAGNIYVVEWVSGGRVTKLERLL
ncbi:MAG: twin-arginine translocation signal domain-containing protein [Verrucomicrobiota bacterium]